MSPSGLTASSYARKSHGRICYNFAPARQLTKLLMCGICTEARCPNSAQSSQLVTSYPGEVSANFDKVGRSRFSTRQDVAWQIVYPEQMSPFIKVICIDSPKKPENILELFQYNNLQYDTSTNRLEMSPIDTSAGFY